MSAYTAATPALEVTRPPGGLRQEAYLKAVAALDWSRLRRLRGSPVADRPRLRFVFGVLRCGNLIAPEAA